MVQENRFGTDNVSTYINDTSPKKGYGNSKFRNKNARSTRTKQIIILSKSMLLKIALISQVALFTTTISGYQMLYPSWQTIRNHQPIPHNQIKNLFENKINNHQYSLFLSSDDWSSFQTMDDDDEIVFGKVLDKQEYAVENDSQDDKEAVGALRSAPTIERNTDPISVPAGKTNVMYYCCNSCCYSHETYKLFLPIKVHNWSCQKIQY